MSTTSGEMERDAVQYGDGGADVGGPPNLYLKPLTQWEPTWFLLRSRTISDYTLQLSFSIV